MYDAKILDILTSYNHFWVSGKVECGVARDILPGCLKQVDSREIVVLKGVRRCGKSTLLAQIVDALLRGGIDQRHVLRLNMEEPLFAAEASVDLLEQIYRTWRERVCPQGRGYLFLDEIQNVPAWESWVRGRSDSENLKVFVTGSSARMLSREIGTKLTGRHVSFEVFPLSFSEYLRFRNASIASELEFSANKPLVRHLFLDYLQYGGFPEVVLKADDEDRRLLLKQYFEDILYRDVVTRHEIRDVASLHSLAVYLLTNTARLTSVHKLKANFSISQDKTENYVSAILESCLVSVARKFGWSLKSVQRAGFKPYAVDTGLRNRVAFSFSEDVGWLVENAVYNHLRRLHEDVFFMVNGGETDFVVKEGMEITARIQVWYDDPARTDIPERELAAFDGLEQEGCRCLLLTNDLEKTVERGKTTVQCLPVAKFLLLPDVLNR